jgi:dihydrodipicolinate synthase/N-acetylneuraminate lyase
MSASPPSAWAGYFAATATPFNADLSLDVGGFRDLLRWLIGEGMHGYAIAGTTGEWTALEPWERRRLFEVAREEIPADTPLLGGCSATSVAETLRHIDSCKALGLDGALLTIPPYVRPTDREIVAFYEHIALRGRFPIVAYNWPLGTGRDLDCALFERIADIDEVVAIKNSTSDQTSFLATLRSLHRRVRVFGIMPGDAGLAMLRGIGGHGCIGASGTLGRAQPGFFEAAWRGDDARALALGGLDQQLMRTLFEGFSGRHGHAIATIKAVLRARGLPAGPVRPPLLSLDAAAATEVAACVRALGLDDVR